jgi:hypothetical protein
MGTRIPIFGPEIDQKVTKTAARPIFSSARGGLEPAFRVLFSAIFHGFSLGKFHQGRKRRILVEGKLLQNVVICTYIFSTRFNLSLLFPRGSKDD